MPFRPITRSDTAFRTLEEIDAWAEAKGGEDAVRISQARGDWADPRSVKLVGEWLRRQDERRAEYERQTAHGLALRTTEATELAATAAAESAKHAKVSARWAIGAVVVAALALLASVWGSLSDLFVRVMR